MITIKEKNKILLFDVVTENIDSSNLEFWFRIHCNEITYSFKGELIDKNKAKVKIPPLTEIINPKYLDTNKIYRANLEIIGEGKYTIIPWEGDIKIESTPKIGVKLENVQEESRIPDVEKSVDKTIEETVEDVGSRGKIEVRMTEIIEEQDQKSDSRISLLEDILGKNKGKL